MATIEFEEAVRLSKATETCVKLIAAKQHIGLNPRFIDQVGKGIREQLNSQLNMYSERLEGAPIAFGKPKCRQRFANILDEQPFLHFDCEVDAVVFQPTIGSHVEAIVNRMGHDHVSCLVHHVFNAAIYKPRNGDQPWAGADLCVGQKVLIQIVKIAIYHGVLNIRGQLLEAREKPAIDPETVLLSQETPTAARDPNISNSNPAQAEGIDEFDSVKKKKKKKEKRKRMISETTETQKPRAVEDVDSTRNKKKKKKKEKLTGTLDSEVESNKKQTQLECNSLVQIQSKKEDNESVGSLDSGLGETSLTPPKDLYDRNHKRKKHKKAKRNTSDSNLELENSVGALGSKSDSLDVSLNSSNVSKKKKSKKNKKSTEDCNFNLDLTLNSETTINSDSAGDRSFIKKKKKKHEKSQDINMDETDKMMNTESLSTENSLELVGESASKKKKKKRKREEIAERLSLSTSELTSSPVYKKTKKNKLSLP